MKFIIRKAQKSEVLELNKIGEKNWVSEFWDNKMPGGIVYVSESQGQLTGVEGFIGGYDMQ